MDHWGDNGIHNGRKAFNESWLPVLPASSTTNICIDWYDPRSLYAYIEYIWCAHILTNGTSVSKYRERVLDENHAHWNILLLNESLQLYSTLSPTSLLSSKRKITNQKEKMLSTLFMHSLHTHSITFNCVVHENTNVRSMLICCSVSLRLFFFHSSFLLFMWNFCFYFSSSSSFRVVSSICITAFWLLSSNDWIMIGVCDEWPHMESDARQSKKSRWKK